MKRHPSLLAAVAALRAAHPVRTVSVVAMEGEVVVTASRLPPHDARLLADATDHSCVRF